MSVPPRQSYILGLHPTSSGMGWILFSGPFSPHDWGIRVTRGHDKNRKCLTHLRKLIARYQPEIIVLEAFERRTSARATRIERLGRAIVSLAASENIDVEIFTRGEVKAHFSRLGAITRQEVAEAIARHIPALSHRVPRPRRAWESDPPRMALFSAAALVITHYHTQATTLLDGLSKPGEGMPES
jgi:Holliday junction resolvasome RuvABC endonuclease subunit